MDLIFCGSGNPRMVEIAREAGWKLGMRSDTNIPQGEVMFVDIDYKKPNWPRHVEIVSRLKPRYATVTDLSVKEVSREDVSRALRQAEQLAPYCEVVFVVPKLPGQTAMLPEWVGVGYSVPSKYGGAQYPVWEIAGRRVHLLGGRPALQMESYRYLSGITQVVSADSNYAHKIAVEFCKYWSGRAWVKHPLFGTEEKDLYFDCWHRSCVTIAQQWMKLLA